LGVAALVILVALVVMWADIGSCKATYGFGKKDIQAANCFEFWLNRYQTMISGLLALSAAGVALWAAKLQIGHAESLAEKKRQAEELAARAGLSFTLDEILSYTKTCLEKCTNIYLAEGVLIQSDLSFPILPQSSIESLKKCIQSCGEENQQKIQNIVSWLQIVQTRLATLHISIVLTEADKSKLRRIIIKLHTINYFTLRLFEYSRTIHKSGYLTELNEYIEDELGKAGFSPFNDEIFYSCINENEFII